ncbi:MAG TPA: hypothetical protein ENN81_03940, partial [Phycisphaerales bacterium]|nr:hypothetical protein [Phycisphaerales bacterium]
MTLSFFPILLLAVALIIVLARILTRWMGADAPANDPERKRILAMVESGKITSQEGAELLDAMGKSSALRAQDAFSRPDIVLLVGVGLVVLGFFLPWVRVRFDALVGIFGRSTACQYGYHVGAVGWAVLIMAIASAIPIFITPSRYLYKISMLQVFLAILGLMIVASLLISAGDKLQVGLVLCALGFAVEMAAA